MRAYKGMSSTLLLVIIAVVLVGGFFIYWATSAPSEKTMMENDKDQAMENPEVMEDKKDGMEDTGGMMTYQGAVLAGSNAKVLDFKKADYEAALKANKHILLYFYANWCPICKEEIPKFYDAIASLETDSVVAFRVNFKDNETDSDEEALARQFGVPYQHTKVFIKNGVQVYKAPDSWDKARYISEITNRLLN